MVVGILKEVHAILADVFAHLRGITKILHRHRVAHLAKDGLVEAFGLRDLFIEGRLDRVLLRKDLRLLNPERRRVALIEYGLEFVDQCS